jgi:hypothetical protein
MHTFASEQQNSYYYGHHHNPRTAHNATEAHV